MAKRSISGNFAMAIMMMMAMVVQCSHQSLLTFGDTELPLGNINMVRAKPIAAENKTGNSSFVVIAYDGLMFTAQMSDHEFDTHLAKRETFIILDFEMLNNSYPKLSKLIESQKTNQDNPDKQGNLARVITMATGDDGHYWLMYWTPEKPPTFQVSIFTEVNRTQFPKEKEAEAANVPIVDMNITIQSANAETVFMSTDRPYLYGLITTHPAKMHVMLMGYDVSKKNFVYTANHTYQFVWHKVNATKSYGIVSENEHVNATITEPFLNQDIITGFFRHESLFVFTVNHTYRIDGILDAKTGFLKDCKTLDSCPVELQLVKDFIDNYVVSLVAIYIIIWVISALLVLVCVTWCCYCFFFENKSDSSKSSAAAASTRRNSTTMDQQQTQQQLPYSKSNSGGGGGVGSNADMNE
ncbi:hypothetical protein DERP_009739 [Dermatophagoides pteronyssinus]|uniref:Uncharacterized protein n=1 Tax=Dermatophagoides pteronyssinus TaxID=6956 RepID=A0ABQ8IR05_DERPT|nr:hypothetical protein DERP_009739 [Dermatophagoides pteronyssinus]